MTPKQFSLWVLTILIVTSVATISGCNLSPSFSKPQRTEDLTSKTIPTSKSWHKVQLLHTLAKYPSGSGWFLVFSPDGQTIVGSSYNGEIKGWNSSTGKLMRTIAPLSVRIEDWLHTLIKQPNTVWAADISPNNQILASGSSDGKIKLWDLNTGHLLRIISGHSQLVAALVFSSDGQTLVSGSHDRIKIWRVPS